MDSMGRMSLVLDLAQATLASSRHLSSGLLGEDQADEALLNAAYVQRTQLFECLVRCLLLWGVPPQRLRSDLADPGPLSDQGQGDFSGFIEAEQALEARLVEAMGSDLGYDSLRVRFEEVVAQIRTVRSALLADDAPLPGQVLPPAGALAATVARA